MKKEIVGINHLKEVSRLLARTYNLLNEGKDILPYAKWQDLISSIKDEVNEHIIDNTKIIGEE